MPANLVFRLKIWCAQDNGIPPRSTPGHIMVTPYITDKYPCPVQTLYSGEYLVHKSVQEYKNVLIELIKSLIEVVVDHGIM